MKRFLGVLMLGLFAVVAFSMRAFADDGCCQGMKKGMCGKMMGAMHGGMENKIDLDEMFSYKANLIMKNAVELGLSDDQVQKIKKLKMDTKKSMIRTDADVAVLILDIREALGKDEIDVNGTNALLDKNYSLKAQEAKTLVGAYAELKKILTKDQMKKLHDIWSRENMEEGKCMTMKGKEGGKGAK